MQKNHLTLKKAFLEDHRHLTRGFSDALKALKKGDLKKAVETAERVDRSAGPHVEFEERVLYPEVAKVRGVQYASRLYREHRIGLDSLKRLMHLKGSNQVEAGQIEKITQGLQTALDHAVSCGTLLSCLTSLDEKKLQQMLRRLLELQAQGRRWSLLSDDKA